MQKLLLVKQKQLHLPVQMDIMLIKLAVSHVKIPSNVLLLVKLVVISLKELDLMQLVMLVQLVQVHVLILPIQLHVLLDTIYKEVYVLQLLQVQLHQLTQYHNLV